jgi:hypothetical protein
MSEGLTLSYLAGRLLGVGARCGLAGRRLHRPSGSAPAAEVARLGRWPRACGDAQDEVLFYSYSVRGVHYTATQDVSGLLDRLPAAPPLMLGPVAVKFLPRNPANSIILSENWSGFRQRTNG